ncbi:MAG: FtsK/SpoIIIE domain-containing protein, partial [Isosphaeraceae bacterium]
MTDAHDPQTLLELEADAVATLEALVTQRARGEAETDATFRARRAEEERAFQAHRQRVTTTAREDTQRTKAKYEAARAEIVSKSAAEIQGIQSDHAESQKTLEERTQAARNAAKKAQEETRWQALALYEAAKDAAKKNYQNNVDALAEATSRLELIEAQAAPALSRTRWFAPKSSAEPVEPPPTDDPIGALNATIDAMDDRLRPLASAWLPKLLAPSAFPWPFFAMAAALAYALAPRMGWGPGAGVAIGITVVAAVVGWLGLARLARSKVAALRPAYTQLNDQARALTALAQRWVKETLERQKDEAEARRAREADAADAQFQAKLADLDQRYDLAKRKVENHYPAKLHAAEERRDAALKEADTLYPGLLDEIQRRFQRQSAELLAHHEAAKAATEAASTAAWAELEARWRDGLAKIGATADHVNAVASQQFLNWHTDDLDGWNPPSVVPDGLRFGTFTVDLKNLPQGLPADPRLQAHGPTRIDLPALTPFPRQSSVLIKAFDAGKAEAVTLLQSLMLRFATSVPPGKVRFTIVDPVGLGENFAAFMHLGDYGELLINNRIWTETSHIEQRLADLSAHMENVIQKYLRNEFETIEAYNAHAGEVAEPFRVLVVANFPTNFSESAARRLVSIASSGARCGVYTLISLDTKQNLPTGVQLKDLEPHCVNFHWREGKLSWRDPRFGGFPLTLDTPPEPERFTRLMHRVGELARDSHRVEVPFEFIAPAPDRYWTSESGSGIDVPLGRSGATKLQHLRLGKGTSQHVLIAGKTGSGKSTLLHALITNTALRYSPDEVELYLIDFKKGVEFKVYATMELPHARVIAVESEREFGLSVLQRLDAELKARGDRFRELGVQDLNAFREATAGSEPMPRILFIVDEFQEFFVEDDKIAQEVSLLLDRLVRQGRAFGIHVHLGSQTLSGAYSLARSTLGQMAVRIALQCSESDAHLILSEENSAARLLTRPGEAIYNDANGLVEGNNFFQVVWLSDERREQYLGKIRDLARAANRPPVSQIIFEGNLPAVPSKNHLLARLLGSPDWPEAPTADHAWLGEAIAIKDPTAAVFRPQSGSNLLIVGQSDAQAVGIMSMAMVSLAAQRGPGKVRFLVFDGSPSDSPLAGRLARVGEVIPHEVQNVSMRQV